MRTTTIAVAALSVLSLAVAQPHGRRHAHEQQHEKKDGNRVVVYTTIVKTIHGQAAAPTPAPIPVISEKVDTQDNAAGSGSGSSSSAGDTVGGSGYGFSYAPFHGDGTCKDVDEVKRDFAAIGDEYSFVRIYGTGCNQAATVLAAAKLHDLKIFGGIFDITQVEAEANLIIDAAKDDWDSFTHISVGNELVNFAPEDQKAAKASEVIAAVHKAKSILKAAGFKGKVATVDTLVAARTFPSICEASDVCAVNCHPFFDGHVVALDAGKFVTEQVATLAKVIPKDQEIIVTETGWPWKGDTNGVAVPSLENQGVAVSSIKKEFKSNKAGVVLFTIFNDHWKTNTAAQFEAEQYWGMDGLDAPSG
jgi:exo-beta-1,3-glucanase (GH17 family)